MRRLSGAAVGGFARRPEPDRFSSCLTTGRPAEGRGIHRSPGTAQTTFRRRDGGKNPNTAKGGHEVWRKRRATSAVLPT
nr:MAG TPA: hypothetical protein [Caudoviricetes sp.]